MNQSSMIAPGLILILLSTGCSASKASRSSNPEMTRCQAELNTIPEVGAAAAKTRSKRTDDGEESLQGMQIALTINRMIRSNLDPDQDQDDWCYIENTRENFDKLVGALKQHGIPPTVDFLAGESLNQGFQEEWLRSGNLIGSMTYAGVSVKKGTVHDFITALAKNERALAPLWVKFERRQKYFRYPGLKLGMDEQRPREIRGFLKQNGYVEVPATIDSRDDYFSQPYCAALARGDKVCANFIIATFRSMLLEKTTRARSVAQQIAGRDVKHILMIQANQLICDSLAELLRWYKAMGVQFIPLDEALRDPFYATEDVTNTANRIIWETRRAQLGERPAE